MIIRLMGLATLATLLGSCGGGSSAPPFHLTDVPGDDGSPGVDAVAPPADVPPADTDDLFQGLLDLEPADAADDSPPGPDTSPDVPPDTPVNPFCIPDGDGLLTAAELPAMAAQGAIATFTQNAPGTTVEVPDLDGTWDATCGCTRWDFTAPAAGDETVYDSVLPVASFWFADRFPDADFVQSFGGGVLGIYLLDDDGLALAGIASAAEDETALAYHPPLTLIALPMGAGDAWQGAGEAVGLFEGQEYPWDTGLTGALSIHHSLDGQVLDTGRISVPAGSFDGWRVGVDLTMEVWNNLAFVPVASERVKIALYLTECTGLIARVRSTAGENADDFGSATEYRRLGVAK